jgi:hypothetical protein
MRSCFVNQSPHCAFISEYVFFRLKCRILSEFGYTVQRE